MSRGGSMPEDRSDADLLDAMRSGDPHAYEELWHRHFDSGLRYARRLFPSRAEDLVSESFLSIYQQVGVAGTGPESVFRPYLKAVIRNTAAHWRRDAARLVDTEDLEPVDHRDGLSRVERQAESAEILATFGELPDRWQRVLWLSEVEEAGRSAIARELGIRPNAVSALQRRARTGMKLRWLDRQVPRALRHDPAHVARLLPRHLSDPADAALATAVAAHVVGCLDCDDLLRGMRGSVTRVQGGALSVVLLGALGAGLPVAASLSTTTAAAAVVTTAGSGLAAWAIGAGVATATVGGLVLTSLFTVSAPPEQPTALVTPVPVPAPDDVPVPDDPAALPVPVGAPAPPLGQSGGPDAVPVPAVLPDGPELAPAVPGTLPATVTSNLRAIGSVPGVQAAFAAEAGLVPAVAEADGSLPPAGAFAATFSAAMDASAPSSTGSMEAESDGSLPAGLPPAGSPLIGSMPDGSVLGGDLWGVATFATPSGGCPGVTVELQIGLP